MSTYDYKKTIEHQFDSFCKNVLRNYARDLYDKEKFQNKHLVSIELLTQTQLNKLSVSDKYDSNYTYFRTYGHNVQIGDIFVAKALETLSKKKQNIVLLSFFLGMSNVDIAILMNLSQSTVHYHKANALQELKKIMKENINEI